jgi:hypothetical protein
VVGWRVPPPLPIRAVVEQWRGWIRVISLWVVALAGVLIARRVVLGGLVGTVPIAAPGIDGLTATQRIWSMLALGGRVGQLLVWPTTQNPHYGPSILPSPPGPTLDAVVTVLVIVLGIAIVCRLAWRASRPDGRPLVGLGWCLIGFLPASNLLTATGQLLAERTLYVSSGGAAMLMAWGLQRAYEYASTRWPGRASVAGLAAATVAAALCIRGYTHATDYAGVWRDHRSLFSQIVRADSLSYRGYQLLAMEAKDHHRPAESAELYARAYALRPSDETLLYEYGEYLLQMDRPRYALAIGQRLMTHADIWTNSRAITLLLNATARVWGVDSVLVAAQRLNARAPSARASLFIGMAYDTKGDSAAARAAYRAGLKVSPRDSALAAHAVRVTDSASTPPNRR